MRKRLPGKRASILLALALAGIAVGCIYNPPVPRPVPPPEYWHPTADYSAVDQDLRLVVLSSSFYGTGGLWYGTLFYAVLAPQELSGWQVTPAPATITDDQGPLGTGRFVPIEAAGGVTLGALVISPFRNSANALKIAFDSMEAKNLTTGEIKEFRGDWRLVPLINLAPDHSPDGTMLGVSVSPESTDPALGSLASGSLELTHQGTRLRCSVSGDYEGSAPPGQFYWDYWVLGQQFWFSEPVPHDVFVLVTSKGEVSRASADEYTQEGFRVRILW